MKRIRWGVADRTCRHTHQHFFVPLYPWGMFTVGQTWVRSLPRFPALASGRISARLVGRHHAGDQGSGANPFQGRLAGIRDDRMALVRLADVVMDDDDTKLRYLFSNTAYRHQLGLDTSEILGKTIREVMGEEAFRRVAPVWEEFSRREDRSAPRTP